MANPKSIAAGAALVLAVGALAWLVLHEDSGAPADPEREPRTEASGSSSGELAIAPLVLDTTSGASAASDAERAARAYAGSAACAACHADQLGAWQGSHHALAERELDPALDRVAFVPDREIVHGGRTSVARERGGVFELVTLGADGSVKPHRVVRAFAVEPLRQYLIQADGGRLQASQLAWDVESEEWFDVFGAERREPGEYGHWTGRGMNWNSSCAACHNTGLEKGYDSESDTYATTAVEMGVSCESCHGPSADHARWRTENPEGGAGDPLLARRLDRELRLDSCGACHARRADLTGRFRPGERFLDHYAPAIPDETDVYLPDGQVRDEDFEFVSFLSSRMHAEGVTCTDCHDPHSGGLQREGNALCLSCHETRPGFALHSNHPPESAGASCVGCHMPLTTYMQRHPRRDHGFTLPDPVLTLEHGVPNACNRCHTDRDAAWAAEHSERWFGAREDDPRRARARAVALARDGDPAAVPGLLRTAREDPIPLWRAVATGLLGAFAQDPEVRAELVARAGDESAWVRFRAASALGPLAWFRVPEALRALGGLIRDPVRAVRVEAARALAPSFDPSHPAVADYARFLAHEGDRPSAKLEAGQWLLARGSAEEALETLRTAAEWDPSSAAMHAALANAYSTAGRPADAVAELELAAKLEPDSADLVYNLALAYSEAGRLEDTVRALADVVTREPAFARAWYNLGLALRETGSTEEALKALARAESFDAAMADAPWATAAILKEEQRYEDALDAARRAVSIDPRHRGAGALMQELERLVAEAPR